MDTKGSKLTQKRVGLAIREAMRRRREVTVWCLEPRGFGCRARPSGGAAYIFQFRTAGGRDGRTQKITIGKTTTFSAEEARLIARAHAQAVAQGRDPRPDGDRKRAGAENGDAPAISADPDPSSPPTLQAVFDLYAAQNANRLSPKSIEGMRSHLRGHLADFVDRPIHAIRRAEIAAKHAGLAATPYAANRALATLSTLFSFAERMEMTPPLGSGWSGNPARGVPRHREAHRDRMLSDAELAALWSALDALATRDRHRFAIAAIRVGALTGWRVGEVRTLEWRDVDLERREALIHGKTGARRAPLPPPVIDLLRPLAAATRHFGLGEHQGRWAFPSTAGETDEKGPLTDWEHRRTWAKVVAQAGLQDVRRHDLRHLVAGVIGMQTGSALRVKEAMGHRSIAVSERYVSPISELQRQSTDRAATLIMAIGAGVSATKDAV